MPGKRGHPCRNFVPLRSNWRWQLAFGVGALDRIRPQATRPLKFNFFGYGRYGITTLADHRLQCISRYVEPSGPGAYLTCICQIDLIANWRMFDALHGNFPWAQVQRHPNAFVPFGIDRCDTTVDRIVLSVFLRESEMLNMPRVPSGLQNLYGSQYWSQGHHPLPSPRRVDVSDRPGQVHLVPKSRHGSLDWCAVIRLGQLI
jgi:hypothetical protein